VSFDLSVIPHKNIILAVTGGIAAYKSAILVRRLKDFGFDVRVVMTQGAQAFITPLTFQALSGNPVHTELLNPEAEAGMGHIELARWADLILVAPASCDSIAKFANGLADDLLSTLYLATKAPVWVAPAMNQQMWAAKATQRNLQTLVEDGVHVIMPDAGEQACGDVGLGRMPEPEDLAKQVAAYFHKAQRAIAEKFGLLAGKRVTITAGPTREAIDPVRYITNHSSGKMGYAIAKMAMLRGADVTLVSGRTALAPPPFVRVVPVVTARDMYEAVTSVSQEQDIIIKAAAVADYRPASVSDEKIKKKDDDMSIALERTDDILKYLGEHKPDGQFLCGFSMETENMIGNSRVKLTRKNLDMVAANNVKMAGAGFQGDTNVLTLITQDEDVSLQLMSKEDAANVILDKILSIQKEREEQ